MFFNSQNLLAYLFKIVPKRIQKYIMIVSLKLHWKILKYLGVIIIPAYHNNISPKHIYNWGMHNFFLKHVNKNMTVLDIGCGEGFLTAKIASKTKRVVAYDSNPKYIETAKRKNNASDIQYFIGDALKDLPKGRYDCVILSSILTFVGDVDLFLNKLHGLTDTLLIRETRYDNHYFVLLSQEFGIKKSDYYEFTKEELINKLKQTGWEIEESFDTYDIFLIAKTSSHRVCKENDYNYEKNSYFFK